jgi:acyl transferase domain-containing protein
VAAQVLTVPGRPIVFMFSGQGSQYFQMGRGLFENHATFRRRMEEMDAIVRNAIGASVLGVLYEGGRRKSDAFTRILLSHPALFMVQYAMAQVLIESGIRPDVVLGASLGTFVAAAVAGCLTVEDALRAIVAHARIVEERCEPGAMIAVLASPRLYERAGLHRFADLAAVNYDAHFVVAAPAGSIGDLEDVLRDERVTIQALPVAFAFHSRWIEAARVPFAGHLRSIRVAPASIPLACCASGRLLHRVPDDHAWHVTREPIWFQRTIQHLESAGPRRYLDVGPSGTLATFTKYALPAGSASTVAAVLSPFGRDCEHLAAAAAAFAG